MAGCIQNRREVQKPHRHSYATLTVIPAHAGIQARASRNLRLKRHNRAWTIHRDHPWWKRAWSLLVRFWIPAFAGMTDAGMTDAGYGFLRN
jgi:hypothetical protein